MQLGPQSFLDMLRGQVGTPPFNPNAPQMPPQNPGWVDKLNSPLSQIGLRMLAAPRGTRLGEAAGNAVLGYQAQKGQSAEDDLRRRYMEAQIKAMGMPNPTQEPSSVREYEYARQNGFQGTFQEWLATGQNSSEPADLQIFRAYQAMSPEDQAIFDKLNGRQQNSYFQQATQVLPDGSTRQGVFDARKGGYTWDQPIVPAGTKPEVDAAGAARGKATVEAQFDLPRVVDNAKQGSEAISNLLNAPGADKIFGVYGMVPVVPGTERADAMAMYNQIKGKTFLEAYNSLKGGGQITEVEGKKAEEAIARLDRAQSWDAAKAALTELQQVIDAGVARAAKKAGPAAAPKKRVRVDENGNVVP